MGTHPDDILPVLQLASHTVENLVLRVIGQSHVFSEWASIHEMVEIADGISISQTGAFHLNSSTCPRSPG